MLKLSKLGSYSRIFPIATSDNQNFAKNHQIIPGDGIFLYFDLQIDYASKHYQFKIFKNLDHLELLAWFQTPISYSNSHNFVKNDQIFTWDCIFLMI